MEEEHWALSGTNAGSIATSAIESRYPSRSNDDGSTGLADADYKGDSSNHTGL